MQAGAPAPRRLGANTFLLPHPLPPSFPALFHFAPFVRRGETAGAALCGEECEHLVQEFDRTPQGGIINIT